MTLSAQQDVFMKEPALYCCFSLVTRSTNKNLLTNDVLYSDVVMK